MRKSIFWPCMVLIVCFALLSLGSACYAEDIKFDLDGRTANVVHALQIDGDDAYQQNELKKQCLTATITAINLEIRHYQRWIDLRKQQGDQKDLEVLQESLDALKADLEKYLAMDAKDYVLPEKVETVAWVGDRLGKDSILYVEGMSKRGPWYHVAGIVGDAYGKVQANAKYQMNFYNVYPRSYWGMDSAYIYIADFGQAEANLTNSRGLNQEIDQPTASGKRIMGEVFMGKSNWPFEESGNDVVKCEEYKIYLLKEQESDAEGELILNAKQSCFDLTISTDKLEKYSYIEFVSPYGNKTLKLGDITDDPLKIVLARTVVLKKPAIYLYPTQKSQITIIHNFKGKILNTYPQYTDHWTVVAEPDGTLLNIEDHRSYKYLFWDGVYAFPNEHYQYKTGFYVKNEDYVSFLQSKLTSIGLNENEINDFIVYWLPVMSHHNNCFVHFRINDNIDGSSILETKPAAETTIRVFMEFSGIDNISTIHKLPEQTLPSFIRKGFTLVEWGGTEIGSNKME